ncbi:GNAT family N-acetyltransferase [candidate division KSB1 bacterium]|nr:GNAT family N-acetyltransferase [candidate division KSB1 bacterium]
MSKVTTIKVLNEETRKQALQIIEAVFLKEKNWIFNADEQISVDIGISSKFSWFLAYVNDEPAGVMRLVYDPPLQLPENFQVMLRDDINLDEIARQGKFVEVGRFMILPQYRRRILVALRLMRIAVQEVVERDYTHFITDVFENEIHSPFNFHTRILGFEVIGKHLYGELNCSCTRIILTLDILKAYKRIKERRGHVYQAVLAGLTDILDKKLAQQTH